MQTEPLFAYQVERGDTIVSGDFIYKVTSMDDTEDVLLFDTRDEDGELTQLPYGPFDTVFIVAKFDDDITVEDIEVDI